MSVIRKSCCEKGNKYPQYSHALSRCLLGFVDPKRIGEGVKAAKQGLLDPCPWTKRGQKVIQKMKEI